MRIDAGLIMGVALEFIVMLYFANTTLQPKKELLCKFIYSFCGIFDYIWTIVI